MFAANRSHKCFVSLIEVDASKRIINLRRCRNHGQRRETEDYASLHPLDGSHMVTCIAIEDARGESGRLGAKICQG